MRELLEEPNLDDVINYSLIFTYEILKMRAKRYRPALVPITIDGEHDKSRKIVLVKELSELDDNDTIF